MTAETKLELSSVNVRIKISALWTSMLWFTRAGGTYWRWYSPVNDWYSAASSSRTKVIIR